MQSQEAPLPPQQGKMGSLLNKISVLSHESLILDPVEANILNMKAEVHSAMRWFEADRTSAYARIKRSYEAFKSAERALETPSEHPKTTPEEAESARRAQVRLQEEQEQAFEAARDAYQIQLTSFLFTRNKEEFRAAKGSLESYDLRKEDKQIEGVIRALHGQHLHMGTGEGKSTVVLPITALIDAATNSDGRVIIGSANGLLVDELKANTTKIAHILDELPFYKDSLTLSDLHEREEKDHKEYDQIIRDMNRDYLTNGALSDQTKEKIKTQHWEKYVTDWSDPHKTMAQDGERTYLGEGDGSIKVFFADEKQLVFDWMKNQELFEKQCPQIFMDEAHVAFDKKTPYTLTNESISLSDFDVRTGAVDWVVRYMVAQKLKPIDVAPHGGQDELKSDALRVKLEALDFKSITVDGTDEDSIQFKNAIGVISSSLGIPPEGQANLQEQILKDLQANVPPANENRLPFGLQRSNKEMRELNKRIKQVKLSLLSDREGDERHKKHTTELHALLDERDLAIRADAESEVRYAQQKTDRELQDLDKKIRQVKLNIMLTGREGGEVHEGYKNELKNLLDEKDVALRANETEPENAHQLYMSDIVTDLARFIRLKDKQFIDQEGGVVIRDSYVDELMEQQKYNPRIQATVLALVGKFEPIKRKIAFKTDTYPSFIHAVKDNIVGFSGTLMYPDPQKARMKKGGFASFLERETGREVKMLAVPEIKPFPQPELHMTTDEVYAQLAKDLKWEGFIDTEVRKQARPTLIVDFNGVSSGMKTYEEMKKLYGEGRVRLLSSKPTEGEAAQKYQQDLDMYRRQLANGDIDVLVSTGSAALGVNFTKDDGSFPDLRTVSLGLPDSEERIAQTIGRRRMKENDTRNHLWYLSMDALETSISLLQSEKHIYKFDLKKTQEEMRHALNKAIVEGDRKKAAKLVFDLMGETRGSRATDDEFQQGYDHLINDEVVPYAKKHLVRKIAKELLHYDEATINLLLDEEFLNGKKEQKPTRQQLIQLSLLDAYYQNLGLPSTLYNDIMAQQMLAQMQNPDLFPTHFIHEQTPMQLQKLRSYVFNSDKDPNTGYHLDTVLDEWFEQSKESVSEYAKMVDLEGVTSRITTPFGTVKHYVTVLPIDENVLEAIPWLESGEHNRLVKQTEAGTFELVHAFDEAYAFPVITDTATGLKFILQIPDQHGTVVQIRKDVSDYRFEGTPLTLGRPFLGNGGEITHRQVPLYMISFDKGDKKE